MIYPTSQYPENSQGNLGQVYLSVDLFSLLISLGQTHNLFIFVVLVANMATAGTQ